MTPYLVCAGVVLLGLVSRTNAFYVPRVHHRETKRLKERYAKSEWLGVAADDEISVDSANRRLVLSSGLLLPLVAPSGSVASIDEVPNFDSLLDLPPISQDCVRLFLCRHGQTENNRLRKVQGARVDPPINENGIQQAENLGRALGRLHTSPTVFFSSNLQRAKMTAKIASTQVDSSISIKQLDCLAEVDFGPVAEGQPVSLAKAGMSATFAAWATGNVDFRPQGGEGESGRDVLQRASVSISQLAKAASESREGSCVAVAHSTFLRILLGMALDVPLLEAASYSILNGSVSVVDVPRDFKTRRLGRNSRLFSGPLRQKIDIEVPICKVIRINEARHLPTKPILM